MALIDLRCDGVSKRYRRTTPRKTAGLGALAGFVEGFRTRVDDFWAVRDVSFEVARGDTLGLVGRNGAGKSTMLKLLGGITGPTEGEITLVGKLSAMIEVGSGFHPELTGRENVFLSGAILGMRRREIAARLDSIADFSGVAAFLDMPVKHYSSGMYVRLGFAIAAHLEPDILLVDEVLAVGDAEFQARCIGRIQELKRNGTTMLLVSHDLGAIEQLADHAVLLDRGRVTATGRPHEVITAYQRLVSGPNALPAGETGEAEPGTAAPGVRVVRLTLQDLAGTPLLTAQTGGPLVASVALAFRSRVGAVIRLSFYDFETGALATECVGDVDELGPSGGEVELRFVIPELLLAPGTYTLGVTAMLRGDDQPVAWRFGRTTLYVQGKTRSGGVFAQPYDCHVVPASEAHGGPQSSRRAS